MVEVGETAPAILLIHFAKVFVRIENEESMWRD